MDQVNIDELIRKAKHLKNNSKSWHHHFLTPDCCFNSGKKFRIILGDEEKGNACYRDFESKPLNQLKKLERLFFDD